jgi:transposase
MAYGEALKRRVLAFYDQGLQTKQIAERLKVSSSWARRVKQRRDQPPRKVGGGHFKLDQAGQAALCRFVQERADATLQQLRDRVREELQVDISIGALWNTLRRLKLTLKKSPWSPRNKSVRT